MSNSKGAIQKANEEVLAEIKDGLAFAGKEYGWPILRLVALSTGIPEPLLALLPTVLRDCFDAYKRYNVEEAGFRAQAFVDAASHASLYEDKYKNVDSKRLRVLLQNLTKSAVSQRQEDRVRVVVAAALGGADVELATPEDLRTAEWLESSPDSAMTLLHELTRDLFGEKEVAQITDKPSSISGQVSYTLPGVADEAFHEKWHLRSSGIMTPLLFADDSGLWRRGTFYVSQDRTVASNAEHQYSTKSNYWPTPLLQRINNAFVRTQQMMKFELNLERDTR